MTIHRKFITLTGLALILGATGSVKAGLDEVVSVEPTGFYVPVGFDDNDEVVTVIDGYLPDTCFRLRPATVEVDVANKRIQVQPRAVQFPGVCLDVTVPYSTTVSLGVIPAGRYRVVSQAGKTVEMLEVKRSSTSGPDDFLYAPIDSAKVDGAQAKLSGRFTNSCSRLHEVKVINSGKTVEVLPIMEQLSAMENGEPCQQVEVPFEKIVSLPAADKGRRLLHVRSLNGQSVNEMFNKK